MKWIVGVLLLVCLSLGYASDNDIYQFNTAKQRKQFDELSWQLRCLVCQNQAIAESQAPLAKDLRHKLAELIRDNQSNEQIIHFMISRYGDFVLYKPPVQSNTMLLWAAPFAFVFFGVLFVFYFVSRHKQMQHKSAGTQREKKRLREVFDENGKRIG